MKKRGKILILLLVVGCLSSAQAVEKEPVKKWLAKQAGIKTLTAGFSQERVLRPGRRPIVSKGRFSFAEPGSFRWQMGEPAVTVAVQKKDSDLIVANIKRKTAVVYPLAVLKAEEAAMGYSFIEAGFPRTIEEFEENFTVAKVESKDGEHHVTVTFNDKKVSVGVRKMVFYLDETSFDLRGFYLRFRDSSSITTRFSNVKKNQELAKGHFKMELDGYDVERAEKKK